MVMIVEVFVVAASVRSDVEDVVSMVVDDDMEEEDVVVKKEE